MRHAFAHPLLLWSLVLLPGLGLLALRGWRRRRQVLTLLGDVRSLGEVRAGGRGARLLRGSCLALGLACLALGAAGPQWGRDWGEAAAPGRDLVVVLDCSRSMLAEAPSRLERARAALLDLNQALRRRGGHRLGLVLFAGR